MEIQRFKCSHCDEWHEGLPALAYKTPEYYNELSDIERKEIAKIGKDFCEIKYPNQVNRFIRVVLFQKVNDFEGTLDYGLWVSLSEENFTDYWDNFNEDEHEAEYFGWLSSSIHGYEATTKIPVTVFVSKGNQRPEIVPHKDFKHQFVKDYYNGITYELAKRKVARLYSKDKPVKEKLSMFDKFEKWLNLN
ncbi:MAG: DUF2199 domain-containing protein [Chitinophagales bacterium]